MASAPTEPQRDYSDEELKMLLAESIEKHFPLVVIQYTEKLKRYAISIVGQVENAEEVVQDTMVNAHTALRKNFPPERILRMSLGGWLRKITYTEALKSLKKNKNRRSSETAMESLEPAEIDRLMRQYSSDTATEAELQEMCEIFSKAFRELSPQERHVFILSIEHDLGYADIGHILGMPEGTVKSHIARARRELRDTLRDQHPEYFDKFGR